MIGFDLKKDRDTIFRRAVSAIQLAIEEKDSVAELRKVKVADTEIDAFVTQPNWEEALEKAKKYFENIEDYEMCQTCVSLIDKTKKLKD